MHSDQRYNSIQIEITAANIRHQSIFPSACREAYRGSRVIVPIILKLSIWWRWVVYCPPWLPYPSTHRRGDWMGCRDSVDVL